MYTILLVAVYECLYLSLQITLFLTLFVTWCSLMLPSDFPWCDATALWCGLTFGTIFRTRKGVVEFLHMHKCCTFIQWLEKKVPFLYAADTICVLITLWLLCEWICQRFTSQDHLIVMFVAQETLFVIALFKLWLYECCWNVLQELNFIFTQSLWVSWFFKCMLVCV